MKKARFSMTPFQLAAHVLAWGLAAWLAWDAWNGNLTVNPIQAATQRTGRYALTLLALSLACTPLNTLFGLRQALPARRTFGLYAFLFAAFHFTIFIWIDYDFNWTFIWEDLADKKYIYVGVTALTILTLLAATSFRWWQKKLGKRWKRLHQMVYLAAPLVVLHFAWARKGNLTRLSGDILLPVLYGLAIALFLVLRIPSVRQWAGRFRNTRNKHVPVSHPTGDLLPGGKKKPQINTDAPDGPR